MRHRATQIENVLIDKARLLSAGSTTMMSLDIICPGIILMMATTVRGSTWNTPLAPGSSMQVLHMMTTLVAGQHSANKRDSMDHPKTSSMHIRGKEVTAVGSTVRTPARFDTTRMMIIGLNIGS
jgi:hypothetical protein